MTWLQAFTFFLALLIIRALLHFVFGSWYFGVIGYSCTLILSHGLVMIIGMRILRTEGIAFFRREPVDSKSVFQLIGLIFFSCLLSLAVNEIDGVIWNGETVRFGLGETMVTKFFSILFVGPIIEEIFFRGFLLPGLLKKNSRVVSILITSVIFLQFHLPALKEMTDPFIASSVSAFFMSLILCVVMTKYNNVTLCIFLHFLFNLFLYVIPIIVALTKIDFGNPFVFWVFVVASIILSLLLIRIYIRRLGLISSMWSSSRAQ